jgi:hypothetical protein
LHSYIELHVYSTNDGSKLYVTRVSAVEDHPELTTFIFKLSSMLFMSTFILLSALNLDKSNSGEQHLQLPVYSILVFALHYMGSSLLLKVQKPRNQQQCSVGM